MGALKGSISIRRYRVMGELPPDAADNVIALKRRILKGVRAHRFEPLDPVDPKVAASDIEQSLGWVAIGDPDLTDLTDARLFSGIAGTEVRMSLRTDTLKAPPAYVRREVLRKVRIREDELGRRLRRDEKQEITELTKRALRKRAFPRSSVSDVVWRVAEERLYHWSTGKSQNERLLDLFARSFGLRLEVDSPARMARRHVESKVLKTVQPTPEFWQGFSTVRPLARLPEESE